MSILHEVLSVIKTNRSFDHERLNIHFAAEFRVTILNMQSKRMVVAVGDEALFFFRRDLNSALPGGILNYVDVKGIMKYRDRPLLAVLSISRGTFGVEANRLLITGEQMDLLLRELRLSYKVFIFKRYGGVADSLIHGPPQITTLNLIPASDIIKLGRRANRILGPPNFGVGGIDDGAELMRDAAVRNSGVCCEQGESIHQVQPFEGMREVVDPTGQWSTFVSDSYEEMNYVEGQGVVLWDAYRDMEIRWSWETLEIAGEADSDASNDPDTLRRLREPLERLKSRYSDDRDVESSEICIPLEEFIVELHCCLDAWDFSDVIPLATSEAVGITYLTSTTQNVRVILRRKFLPPSMNAVGFFAIDVSHYVSVDCERKVKSFTDLRKEAQFVASSIHYRLKRASPCNVTIQAAVDALTLSYTVSVRVMRASQMSPSWLPLARLLVIRLMQLGRVSSADIPFPLGFTSFTSLKQDDVRFQELIQDRQGRRKWAVVPRGADEVPPENLYHTGTDNRELSVLKHVAVASCFFHRWYYRFSSWFLAHIIEGELAAWVRPELLAGMLSAENSELSAAEGREVQFVMDWLLHMRDSLYRAPLFEIYHEPAAFVVHLGGSRQAYVGGTCLTISLGITRHLKDALCNQHGVTSHSEDYPPMVLNSDLVPVLFANRGKYLDHLFKRNYRSLREDIKSRSDEGELRRTLDEAILLQIETLRAMGPEEAFILRLAGMFSVTPGIPGLAIQCCRILLDQVLESNVLDAWRAALENPAVLRRSYKALGDIGTAVVAIGRGATQGSDAAFIALKCCAKFVTLHPICQEIAVNEKVFMMCQEALQYRGRPEASNHAVSILINTVRSDAMATSFDRQSGMLEVLVDQLFQSYVFIMLNLYDNEDERPMRFVEGCEPEETRSESRFKSHLMLCSGILGLFGQLMGSSQGLASFLHRTFPVLDVALPLYHLTTSRNRCRVLFFLTAVGPISHLVSSRILRHMQSDLLNCVKGIEMPDDLEILHPESRKYLIQEIVRSYDLLFALASDLSCAANMQWPVDIRLEDVYINLFPTVNDPRLEPFIERKSRLDQIMRRQKYLSTTDGMLSNNKEALVSLK